MKWIYIVTWTLVNVWIGFPRPTANEYGIIDNTINAVAKVYSYTKSMKKEFSTKEDAEKFIANAPKRLSKHLSIPSSYTKDFKLDSVLIKQLKVVK